MIVMGLKEGKQKVRDRILEADKQIKEAVLELPESVAKTRFLAVVDKAKANFLTALEDINWDLVTLLFGAGSQSKSTFDIYFSNSETYLLYALRSLT